MKKMPAHKLSHEWLIHLLAWMFLFGLPPMLMSHPNEHMEDGELLRMIGPPLAMGIVFYINYLWLVPRLLLEKKHKTYVLINVLLCVGMLFFIHFWFTLGEAYFHIQPPVAPHDGGLEVWRSLMFRLRDFIMLGLIAALAAVIRMSQRWHVAELGRQNAELRRVEAELKNLHNQINPHFLLNTLNNIYALIAFDAEKAQQAVQDLSRLLRHLLYDNSIRIAPLIFISLLENAFKHGVSTIKPSFIHIRIYCPHEGFLTCHIANSYFPKQRNDISGSGIGLEQVQKRLDLTYPGKYQWTKGPDESLTVYQSILTLQTSAS